MASSRLERLYERDVNQGQRAVEEKVYSEMMRWLPELSSRLFLDGLIDQVELHRGIAPGRDGLVTLIQDHSKIGVQGQRRPIIATRRGLRSTDPDPALLPSLVVALSDKANLVIEPVYDDRDDEWSSGDARFPVDDVAGIAVTLKRQAGDLHKEKGVILTKKGLASITDNPRYRPEPYDRAPHSSDVMTAAWLVDVAKEVTAHDQLRPEIESWLSEGGIRKKELDLELSQKRRAEEEKTLLRVRKATAKLLGVGPEELLFESAESGPRLRLVLDTNVSLYIVSDQWYAGRVVIYGYVRRDDEVARFPALTAAHSMAGHTFSIAIRRTALRQLELTPRARYSEVSVDALRRTYLTEAQRLYDQQIAELAPSAPKPKLDTFNEFQDAFGRVEPSGLEAEREL